MKYLLEKAESDASGRDYRLSSESPYSLPVVAGVADAVEDDQVSITESLRGTLQGLNRLPVRGDA